MATHDYGAPQATATGSKNTDSPEITTGRVTGWQVICIDNEWISMDFAWDKMTEKFEVKTQPNGVGQYIDLEGVEILDSHTGTPTMVPCLRMFRDPADKWLNIDTQGYRSITCIPEHPLLVNYCHRVLANHLKPGDTLVLADYWNYPKTGNRIVSVEEYFDYDGDSEYAYGVATGTGFFDVSGIVSYN